MKKVELFIRVKQKIYKLNIETIPVGYILIDGDNESAVSRVSNTSAMPQQSIGKIVDTAIAGEYLGMKLIYLEAGSGAKTPVNERIIKAVSEAITIPLIVGGGIWDGQSARRAVHAGADWVVTGSLTEEFDDPDELQRTLSQLISNIGST